MRFCGRLSTRCTGIPLLRNWRHDQLVQYQNYAMLLLELGKPEQGYQIMEQAEKIVRQWNSDQCPFYAEVRHRMGYLALVMGKRDEAREHFQRAQELYSQNRSEDSEQLQSVTHQLQQALIFCGTMG